MRADRLRTLRGKGNYSIQYKPSKIELILENIISNINPNLSKLRSIFNIHGSNNIDASIGVLNPRCNENSKLGESTTWAENDNARVSVSINGFVGLERKCQSIIQDMYLSIVYKRLFFEESCSRNSLWLVLDSGFKTTVENKYYETITFDYRFHDFFLSAIVEVKNNKTKIDLQVSDALKVDILKKNLNDLCKREIGVEISDSPKASLYFLNFYFNNFIRNDVLYSPSDNELALYKLITSNGMLFPILNYRGFENFEKSKGLIFSWDSIKDELKVRYKRYLEKDCCYYDTGFLINKPQGFINNPERYYEKIIFSKGNLSFEFNIKRGRITSKLPKEYFPEPKKPIRDILADSFNYISRM